MFLFVLTCCVFTFCDEHVEAAERDVTVTYDLFLGQSPTALTVGVGRLGRPWQFSVGFETSSWEPSWGFVSEFGLYADANYMYRFNFGDQRNIWRSFSLSLGGGLGYRAFIVMETTDYDVLGLEISYPDLDADSLFYGNAMLVALYGNVAVTGRFRYDGRDPRFSLGIGFRFRT